MSDEKVEQVAKKQAPQAPPATKKHQPVSLKERAAMVTKCSEILDKQKNDF